MKRKLIAMVTACTLAIGMLAGCGGTGESTPTEGAVKTDSSVEASESSAEAQNEAEGTVYLPELTLGSSMAWETLTPFRTMRVWQIVYARLLYDSLAYIAKGGELVPVVAKSWEVEEDGLTWDIEIYDYVYDSEGNHITSDDIVWILEEQMKQALKPCYNQVNSVEKTGDYTLKIVLKSDMVGLINNVLMQTYVVSRTAYEADPDGFASKVVSTAPYQLTEFVSGSSITLEKRDDYWQKEELIPACMANNIQKLTVKYISEASQQQIALETGEIQGYLSITQNLIGSLDSSVFTVIANPALTATTLRFSGHETKAIASDENLRKAIAYAIDENGIIAGVYNGYAETMTGPEAKGQLGYLDTWTKEENYQYDVEKAKEYLAKSNYGGETLEILASSSAANERLCTMIQAYLLEVGIQTKLNLVERSLYTAMTYDGTAFDMEIMSPGGIDLPSAWQSSYDMTSYNGKDASGRSDEVLTDMIKKASTNEGFTDENINAVHEYVLEHVYDYGICQPQQCDVIRTDIGLKEMVTMAAGGVDYAACVYSK